ncbi:MAG: hypothetical protein KBD83_00250 [Gammaproteobacteria bacterium]|nr:hypothetical protein [Gammaproteobacteria bacterium]
MLTIDLLQEVIAKPLKVARYSTQFMRRRLGIGELKNTYPFSPEMFQGFVEAFKTVQGEHPSVTERIPDTTIKSSDYESSLVVFLKKHCDGTQTIKLTKAVLAAAIAFINHHPGSPLHEFMMLHQLTETLKFAGSADYEQRMLAREHAVLQQILSIHYCLDDQCNPEMPRVDRIQQALSLMSQERSVSLDQRKLALLMLESYHISSVSYASGRFDVNAHEAKNFRFILELSTIQATNELAAHATASSTRPAVNSALSRHEKIQTVTVALGENVEIISQPKTLGPLWEAFFEKLFNASRGKDPVTTMTEVVMGNFLINSSKFIKPLQAWFAAFDQYYAEMNSEDIISRNYCKLYDFMKENGQLPADAREPVRAVVQEDVASSTNQIIEQGDVDQFLLASSQQECSTTADNLMLEEKRPAVTSGDEDVKERNQLPAVEEKANDTVIATTEPPEVQRTKKVYQTPQKKRFRASEFEPTTLSPIEGSPSGVPQSSGKKNATPMSENLSHTPVVLDAELSAVESSASVAVQGSESFAELLAMKKPQEVQEKGALGGLAGKAANTVTRFDEDDDNASTIGYSDVGSEYSYNEDEAVFFYVPEFSPENSDFANKFIQAIQHYYSSDSAFSDKNAIVLTLINATLSWYQQAKKLGVIARAPQALHELNKLLQTTDISLDNAYRYLYAILHATVFATRLRQAKVEEIRSFYQDAGATLMQLSAQVASEIGLPAHTWMLQQVDSTHRQLLEILTYKDEKQVKNVHDNDVLSNTSEYVHKAAVSILEKLPFIWQSLYPLVITDRAVDFKRVEGRRRVEALCADVLARILAKTPGTLTIAEQALVVRVAEDYASQTTTTPFYNAFRFLVVTHHDVETGVALVGSELAIERGKMLYGQLFRQLRLFDLAGSSRQEQLMTNYLTAYVEKLQPTVSVVSDSIDWDITSDASGRKSTKSSGSAYSYKSAGSGKSAVSSGGMHARAFEKAGVINEGVKSIWSTTVLKASLSKNEVKFILKNYEGMCRETDFDTTQSTLLLHRAFDWLRALSSTQRDISTGGMFSRGPKEIEHIASDDYNGLMGYVISKKGVPELFVRYCEYQVARMSQSGQVMKTYEIKFIMQNLRSLCIHKDALDNGEALVASTLNLVSAEWNKQLAKLEAKTTLASEDVKAIQAHYHMTHDDNKPSKRLKGNQVLKDVCDRVSALYDKAHPKPKSSAAVGKNK